MREKRFISWQGDCSIIILLCSKLTSFAVSGNLAAAAVLQKKACACCEGQFSLDKCPARNSVNSSRLVYTNFPSV